MAKTVPESVDIGKLCCNTRQKTEDSVRVPSTKQLINSATNLAAICLMLSSSPGWYQVLLICGTKPADCRYREGLLVTRAGKT